MKIKHISIIMTSIESYHILYFVLIRFHFISKFRRRQILCIDSGYCFVCLNFETITKLFANHFKLSSSEL